jgi:hypothetical protein
MTTYTVTPEVARALPGQGDCFELRSVDGQLLGTFIPAAGPIDRSNWPPELTQEELDRIAAEQPWFTTAEVLAHLKSL